MSRLSATLATPRSRLRPAGGRPGAARAAVGRPVRPVRVPELALGLLLVVTCVFAALLWNRSVTTGRTIVVASGDIARGSIIDAADLAPAEVRGATDVGFVSGDDASELVGTVALVDISAGEPLTGSAVTQTDPLRPDEGLTSVSLERGDAPVDLGPGDTVRVVVVPLADPVEPTPPTMLELVAEVWDVAPANEYEPTAVVTLRLPLTEAATVAGADSVRLVRVEP